ncbi:MAG: TlpA family protein disulfide reductase [Akkermansiaceae bacterium]|nr:TlpA family protein disulfide reductase [Akkermansiaceae bacterium]
MKTILLTTVVTCSLLMHSMAKEPSVGQALPSLSQLLPGSSVPKTKGKVVLVDFWASWCAPCKASFPCFTRLHNKYASKGLVIIAIGVDEDVRKYKAFAAKNKAPFLLAHDSSHKAAAFFNPPTMPSSYLVDRKGVIRHIHKGFKGKKTEALYEKEIIALLGK